MFIAALFTIVILESAEVPTTDEWIKKITMENYSAIKKIEIMSFAGK
jgi:hypothetical protein